jgi:hypothetical protein
MLVGSGPDCLAPTVIAARISIIRRPQCSETMATSGIFLAATFENWQSEFLQLLAIVGLTFFLIHRGSAESKDSNDRMKAKLDRIQKKGMINFPNVTARSAAKTGRGCEARAGAFWRGGVVSLILSQRWSLEAQLSAPIALCGCAKKSTQRERCRDGVV